MSDKYVLAIDQGTTSSRAIIFDHKGTIVSVSQKEHEQIFPRAGWVEHNPIEVWDNVRAVVADALASASLNHHDIAAVGITNQRETTLLWERASGKALAPAIVWQDRRTAAICEALTAAGHGPLFTARTGLLLDPYFSGTKLAWLLDAIPGARDRAGRGELAFGTVDSWLMWRLTGGRRHVTDVTNASRTHLFDIHRGRWDEELLGLLYDYADAIVPDA